MKRIIALLILCFSANSACAYEFDTKMQVKVLEADKKMNDFGGYGGTFTLKVTEHLAKKIKDPYPVGSIIKLRIVETTKADYFNNPKIMTKVQSISLPDGTQAKKSYKTFELKGISGIKSYWIPFYRLSKLFGDKDKRTIKQGSYLVLKPTKANKVIGILET